MDVVKTNIELLEGSLVIDSLPGLGTAMILRMPLTLAIIPCLIVTVSGERYAIPQRELEEAVCLHPGMSGRIEQAFDTEVYRLRDRLLPIVRLRDVLNRPAPFTPERRRRSWPPTRRARTSIRPVSSTSWSCGCQAADLDWLSMRCEAPRKSSSSRCTLRSSVSASSPARRSWATAVSP